MAEERFVGGRKKGIKTAIYVDLLILVLALIILASGSPIGYFKTTALSALYAIIAYVPVIFVCILALRKLRK
ncbi:MAG: hypothetical protein JRN20_03845 [Nitrososphaerota archaeon]|nr:hypothetical protein [Nitrososphaerota archaeon]